MGLIKYMDKKMTFDSQKGYMFAYLYGGLPIGYLIGQGLTIWSKSWDKYHFSLEGLVIHTIMILSICSPFIINYFRQTKKLKLIVKKHRNKTLVYKVKATENYKDFVKGQTYDLEVYDHFVGKKGKWISQVYNGKGWSYDLKNIINKFELVYNIKEERNRKLKKLQKIIK